VVIVFIAYCFAEEKRIIASLVHTQVMVQLMEHLFIQDLNQLLFYLKESSSTSGTWYDWGMMDNKRANHI
jgi:hypothetical protein